MLGQLSYVDIEFHDGFSCTWHPIIVINPTVQPTYHSLSGRIDRRAFSFPRDFKASIMEYVYIRHNLITRYSNATGGFFFFLSLMNGEKTQPLKK